MRTVQNTGYCSSTSLLSSNPSSMTPPYTRIHPPTATLFRVGLDSFMYLKYRTDTYSNTCQKRSVVIGLVLRQDSLVILETYMGSIKRETPHSDGTHFLYPTWYCLQYGQLMSIQSPYYTLKMTVQVNIKLLDLQCVCALILTNLFVRQHIDPTFLLQNTITCIWHTTCEYFSNWHITMSTVSNPEKSNNQRDVLSYVTLFFACRGWNTGSTWMLLSQQHNRKWWRGTQCPQ